MALLRAHYGLLRADFGRIFCCRSFYAKKKFAQKMRQALILLFEFDIYYHFI